MFIKKIFFLSAGGGVLFALFILYRLFYPLDPKGQSAVLDIPPGKTFYQIAKELEEKKLIRSHKEMKILIRLFSLPPLLQGSYELSPQMSLWRIFQKLKKGKEKLVVIRFPEGLNHYEMAQLLKSHNLPSAKSFLKEVWNKKLIKKLLNEDLDSFEGYLFPDSYHIRRYISAPALIELMVKRFLELYKKVSESSGQGLRESQLSTSKNMSFVLKKPLSRRDRVILASLIEKETGAKEERALIAGVFYNRLKLNMKLQTDPSILYALYLSRGFDIEKNIRKKDILFPSPYNTYVVHGLPPGPVANPGEKSLKAVFQPEPSDYLYFVSRNDGSHKFSTNYKEHQKAVYKYQIKAFKKIRP